MDELILKGTPIGTMYKRTTARPIDSSEIFDTFEDAEMYAKNTNKTFVPYPGQIVSVKGGNIYKLVIDPTMPNDSAEGFYHCKLAIIGSNDEYDKRYIRKDVEDSAQKLIHFLEGINTKGVSTLEQITLLKNIVSDNFATGLSGFGIVRDSDDNYHLDIDFVNIRRKLTVEEIQVQRTYYVGGKQYSTPGGGIICSAVEDKGTEWRCYFKTEDAEGRTVRNTFEPEDYAICETFNLEKKEGSVFGNHYYWRLVVRKGDDYIDLSKSVCSASSDAPKVGDEIVQLGNRTDKNRQGAIVLDSVTAGGPYIRVFKGINSYHLPKPNIDLNPELSTIKAKFISEATGKEVDSVLESMKADLDVVRKQTDKEYTMWFFEYDPALDNLPASEWNTDELKSMHEQDMFYNRDTGYAYRFEKYGNTWSWNSIADHQTVKALGDAAKAQSTADGKRRVFVEQPTNAQAYDIGDTWVNATYPSVAPYAYENDSLVCKKSKAAGVAFNIEHWQPISNATTAYIKNTGDEILLTASSDGRDYTEKMIDAANKATNEVLKGYVNNGVFDSYKESTSAKLGTFATTSYVSDQMTASISAYFDENGKLKNTAGLVTGNGTFATLFANALDADETIVKQAQMSIYITEDDAKKIVTHADIRADQITLEGVVTANNNFKILADGTMEAVNGKFSGDLVGVSGSFKSLNCINDSGKILGGINFGSDGKMWFSGDMYHQGYDYTNNRSYRMYSADFWCRGSLGARQRNTLVVLGSFGYYYVNGLDGESEKVYVSFTSATSSNNEVYYTIPLYGTTGDASGFPVDLLIIKTAGTFRYLLNGAKSQRVMIINAHDQNSNIYIYSNGSKVQWNGGKMAECVNIEDFMYPVPDNNLLGRGWIVGAALDNNWA